MEPVKDDVSRAVNDMYSRFPYPSPTRGRRRYTELSNLLGLFSREAGIDLNGKAILDAGTGTGHRILEAAASFRNATFVGVDFTEASLAVARATAAAEGIDNIDFRWHNLLDDNVRIGNFDIVTSMGVLGHLADPRRGLRNLVNQIGKDGIVLFYLYGVHGSRERMRRKGLVATLLRGQVDFERGVQMVKDLGFVADEYGWRHDHEDAATVNGMIVDAFLNVSETFYDCDAIHDLVTQSGLPRYVIYGITAQKGGWLVDTVPKGSRTLLSRVTDVSPFLTSDLLREAYAALDVRKRYRVIDLLFQPNGYTVVAFADGLRHLPPDHRLLRNTVSIS